MPRLRYEASDFPSSLGSKYSGNHSIDVTWHELVWAAVSVGKRGLGDMITHGAHSIDEIYYRSYIVWANLWEHGGRFYRSPAYETLDPTEKGAISYFFGMTIAKLIASRLFDAHWMVHLDRLVNYHSVGLVGRSRPDLAGVDALGRWLIVEGKGRTGRYSQATMNQAKAQVRQVRSIDGAPPFLRIGCQSFFAPSLSLSIVDPDTARDGSVDLDIHPFQLRGAYYERFGSLRRRRTRSIYLAGRPHEVLDIEELGLSVGIAEGAESRFPLDSEAFPTADGSMESIIPSDEDGQYDFRVFPDGLSIGLTEQWSISAMGRVPSER